MTPEYDRFKAYVERTSREPAQAKRLALFQALQYGHTSIAALSAAVGGNALLRTWISQAMRDGAIVREDGQFRLPSARGKSAALSLPDVPSLLAHIGQLTAAYHTLPEGVERYTLMAIHYRATEDQTDRYALDNANESDQDEFESEET
jgi:hypothetical protein